MAVSPQRRLVTVLFGILCWFACYLKVVVVYSRCEQSNPADLVLTSKPVAYCSETIYHLPPIMGRKPWTQIGAVVTGFRTLLLVGHHTLWKSQAEPVVNNLHFMAAEPAHVNSTTTLWLIHWPIKHPLVSNLLLPNTCFPFSFYLYSVPLGN